MINNLFMRMLYLALITFRDKFSEALAKLETEYHEAKISSGGALIGIIKKSLIHIF